MKLFHHFRTKCGNEEYRSRTMFCRAEWRLHTHRTILSLMSVHLGQSSHNVSNFLYTVIANNTLTILLLRNSSRQTQCLLGYFIERVCESLSILIVHLRVEWRPVRQSAIIHVLTKTPLTQRSRKVVRFMQNEREFILYRAQRTNVDLNCS